MTESVEIFIYENYSYRERLTVGFCISNFDGLSTSFRLSRRS